MISSTQFYKANSLPQIRCTAENSWPELTLNNSVAPLYSHSLDARFPFPYSPISSRYGPCKENTRHVIAIQPVHWYAGCCLATKNALLIVACAYFGHDLEMDVPYCCHAIIGEDVYRPLLTNTSQYDNEVRMGLALVLVRAGKKKNLLDWNIHIKQKWTRGHKRSGP
jgi:hypothetical protein